MNVTDFLIQKASTAYGPGESPIAVKQNITHSTYKALSPKQKKKNQLYIKEK